MRRAADLLTRVREFWEAHPVAAAAIPYPLGTPEYFRAYDHLREENESVEFSNRLHEYAKFGGHRVLDVGCGNGYVLSTYAEAGASVIGVDLTRAAIALCQKRFSLNGLRGAFVVGNAEELPFPNEAFDCVCAMGVVHHTPNPADAINELARVLRRGGRLIMMVYHRGSAQFRVKMWARSVLSGKTRQQLVNEVDGRTNPKGDVYSKAELCAILERFDVTDLFAGCLGKLPLSGTVVRRALGPLERRWGWFLYAKAIKP